MKAFKFNKTDTINSFEATEIFVVLADDQKAAEKKLVDYLVDFYGDAEVETDDEGDFIDPGHGRVTWEFSQPVPKHLADERVVNVIK